MITPTKTIEDTNLSRAWARAFIAAAKPGVEAIVPLVVTIHISEQLPLEESSIRSELDKFLSKYAKIRSSNTTANIIFPMSLWNSALDRQVLYDRYMRLLPHIKKDRQNRNGIYFERMVHYGPAGQENNQLFHVLSTYESGNHRTSALQLCIFDPARDHTNQRMRGFPCLQQVNFIPHNGHELQVVGVYATQWLADRAYGNYLGLYHLGRFVAHELGMTLTRLTCIAPKAEIGTPSKGEAQEFVDILRGLPCGALISED